MPKKLTDTPAVYSVAQSVPTALPENLKRLSERLAGFKGKLVSMQILVDKSGDPVVWVVDDEKRVEGLAP